MGLVTMLCWGISDVLSKKGISTTTVLKFLFWTQLIGALVVGIIGLGTGELVDFDGRVLRWMLLLGLMNVTAMYMYYRSFQLKGVALSVAIVKVWAIPAVVLGMIFFGEFPDLNEYLAMGLILLGLFGITKKSGKFHLDKSYWLPFVTMLYWGLIFFLVDLSSGLVNETWTSLGIKGFSAVFMLPLFVSRPLDLFKMKPLAWVLVLVVGALDGLGLLAFSYGTQLGTLAQVSTVVAVIPAFVAVLSVWILKEKISRAQWGGIILSAIGLVLLAAL